MNKRGQVTIFIIIAIILVAGIALVYTLYGDAISSRLESASRQKFVDPAIISIDEFVRDCLKNTAKDALVFTGQRGGYSEVPPLSNDINIPYYYYKGRDLMPSKEKIEEEISKYIDFSLFFCIQSFSYFPGFEIREDKIKIKTTIEEDVVSFDIDYPLTIVKNQTIYELKDFEFKIPIRLETVYNVARFIVQKQIEDPENICISCVLEEANKADVKIDMMDFDQDIIFTITDENSLIDDVPYEFKFANKYS